MDADFDDPQIHEPAVDLALGAWASRQAADREVSELTPDWPTHRQPPVDRAILRLAHYEISSGHAPAKVAINEAVELAKQYAAENSPAFINGVLDKLAKKRGIAAEPPLPVDEAATKAPKAHRDAWLADAIDSDQV